MGGDLITYNQSKSVAIVLHVMPDFLIVLNSSNEKENVKLQAVTKKLIPRRNTFLMDS